MEKLYHAGFRDTDCLDDSQQTPLMIKASNMSVRSAVDASQWLVSNGADPLKRINADSVVQMSYVAGQLSTRAAEEFCSLHGHGLRRHNEIGEITEPVFADLAQGLELLSQHSHISAADACQCLCSRHPCTPLSVFLRGTWRWVHEQYYYWTPCDDICLSRWKDTRNIANGVSTRLTTCLQAYRYSLSFFADWTLKSLYRNQDVPDTFFDRIIRVFLFTELELTHTCCQEDDRGWRSHFSPKSDGEVHEIQEKEKELIQEFEALCEEANRRRLTFPGSFCDFLYEFMTEVDDKPRGKVSKEDAQEFKDIGVVFDPDCIEA